MPATFDKRIAFASPNVRLSPAKHTEAAFAALAPQPAFDPRDEQPAPPFMEVCARNEADMLEEARNARPGFWREWCLKQARMWRRLMEATGG